MRITTLRYLAPPLALVALVTACGDDTTDPATTEPVTTVPADTEPVAEPVALDGRTFLSTGSTGFDIVAGSSIRLTFVDGTLSANAGCNSMSGGYALDGSVLQVQAMTTTEMACEEQLMDQDTRLGELLSSGPTVSLAGDELTLTSGDASLVLLDREVADPDRPLEGTTWTVTTIITGDAASSVPTESPATLVITAGTATVNAGCNTGSAAVTVDDATITFGPLALTEMMCDDATMALESAVIATLTDEATYEIEAGTLTLTNGTDGLQLTADA